jgi:hypothetical protein
MSPVKKRSRFRPDELVICLDTFAGGDGRIGFGERVRADNPWVARIGEDKFVPDGTPDDEIQRRRQALNSRELADVPVTVPERNTRIEKRIPDKDAVIQVLGYGSGTRAQKGSRLAKSGHGLWVPVVPDPSLDRRDALIATETMRTLGEDGKPIRTLYAGQWCHRDDEFVTLHPHLFALPHVQDREE